MIKSNVKSVVVFCLVFVCVIASCLSAFSAEKSKGRAKITITSPADDAKLGGQIQMVAGTVSNPNLNVYLLIHPMTTDSCWAQNLPSVDEKGKWRARVFLGEESRGIGEPFEIIAVASEKEGLFKNGDVTKYPLPKNPNIIAKTSIVVNRTK